MGLGDGELRELASGVDALYLSGVASVPDSLLDELARRQTDAQDASGPVAFQFGAERLALASGGMGRYRYRLDHANGVIAITPRQSLPAFRIQPRAELLHSWGERATIAWFTSLVESVIGTTQWSVNRLDLFIDVQGWDLSGEDRDRFVRRAKACRTDHDGGLFTGFTFGRRKTGTVGARIYDKTHEVALKGHTYWYDIWGDRHTVGERVLRVEFETHTTFLRDLRLADPVSVLDNAPGIWAHLTEEWLRFCVPSDDATTARWPVAEEWRLVQAATLRADAVALDRIRDEARMVSLRRALQALYGHTVSFGAVAGHVTLEAALDAALPALRRYELDAGKDFPAMVADRLLRYGIA